MLIKGKKETTRLQGGDVLTVQFADKHRPLLQVFRPGADLCFNDGDDKELLPTMPGDMIEGMYAVTFFLLIADINGLATSEIEKDDTGQARYFRTILR